MTNEIEEKFICAGAGRAAGPGTGPPGLPAAAHAADVADQRDFGHQRSRRDLIAGSGTAPTLSKVLGCVAVTASTINIVAGFLITDRMLKMFRKKEGAK